MPIVTIQALPPDKSIKVERLLTLLVNELAAALETPPGNVWANFTPMAAVREGDSINGRPSYHPVVTILANPRSQELIRRGLEAVGRAVGSGLGVSVESVWVHWITLEPGHVFADGEIK